MIQDQTIIILCESLSTTNIHLLLFVKRPLNLQLGRSYIANNNDLSQLLRCFGYLGFKNF